MSVDVAVTDKKTYKTLVDLGLCGSRVFLNDVLNSMKMNSVGAIDLWRVFRAAVS